MRNFKLIYKGKEFDLGDGRSPRGIGIGDKRPESISIKIDEEFNSLQLNKLIRYLGQLYAALSITDRHFFESQPIKLNPKVIKQLSYRGWIVESEDPLKIRNLISDKIVVGQEARMMVLVANNDFDNAWKVYNENKIFIGCDHAIGEDKTVVTKVEIDKKDGINVTFVERPPIGLKPKEIHEEHVKKDRFNDICGAISRYYNASLKIPVEWINEYNELVGNVLNIGKEK
jgi:hypothetical protein